MNTYYIDTHDKIKKDVVVSLISDLHICDNTNYYDLNKVIKQIKNINPNYIFLLGDIVNDSTLSPILLDKTYHYLSTISNIAPVYSILGNHDIMTKEDNNWIEKNNKDYLDMLNSINNFKMLDNEDCFLCENIQLLGLKLPFDYYELSFENKEEYINIINNYINNNVFNNYNSNSYNILLQHTPNNIFEKEIYLQILNSIRDYLDREVNIDLIISGHLHNGLVPSYIDCLPGNRGIVGITGSKINLFQDNCRGIKKITDNTNGIVVPAVTSLAEHQFLNKFYPAKSKTLVLKK